MGITPMRDANANVLSMSLPNDFGSSREWLLHVFPSLISLTICVSALQIMFRRVVLLVQFSLYPLLGNFGCGIASSSSLGSPLSGLLLCPLLALVSSLRQRRLGQLGACYLHLFLCLGFKCPLSPPCCLLHLLFALPRLFLLRRHLLMCLRLCNTSFSHLCSLILSAVWRL